MPASSLPANFGEKISALRGAARIRQNELGQAMGVDASTISRYEGGDLVPSLADAQRLLLKIGTPEATDYAGYLGQDWRWLPRPDYEHPQRSSLWLAETALQRIARFREESTSEAARAHGEILESALRREADYLLDTAHDMPFVGTIGVGKTTALCVALGLMLPPYDGQSTASRTVLEVGGGNTTTCEVVAIHHPKRYGLIVQPESEEEIALHVNDLCGGVLAAQKADEAGETELRSVPREIDRAIRNMSGLLKRQVKTPDGGRQTLDPLVELARGRNVESLAFEVFQRLKLWQRTRTEIWYEASSGEAPQTWLRKMFSEVNNGRLPDVNLPRQITVVSPLQLAARNCYQLRVIDSKGIDEPLADRPDLRSYLENPRTTPVLCSTFVSAPDSEIVQLLNATIETGTSTGAAQRAIVLILPKNQEAFQVKHDSGEPPESVEEAYELKADNVRGALRHFVRDGLRIFTYNAENDDASRFVQELLARIEEVRTTHVKSIEQTARAVDELLEEAKRAAVAGLYVRVHEQIKEICTHITHLPASSVQPYQKLLSAITTLHQRTVWATLVRQGTWGNLDVYHYLGTGFAVDARERCAPHVHELEAALGRMLADDSLAPIHGLLKEAVKSVEYSKDQFLQAAARLGKDSFRPALRGALALWKACTDEYGRGYGFRDRVASHFRAWFEDAAQAGMAGVIEEALADQWRTCFVDNVQKIVASLQPPSGRAVSGQ